MKTVNSNLKRNMVQVRLTDNQLSEFEEVKQQLNAKNNATALRTLITDRKLLTKHDDIKLINDKFDDLLAKADGLLWSSSNITKSLNQIAHAANSAQQVDPANIKTWSWIVQQLNSILPAVESLKQFANSTKKYCNKLRG